MSDSDSDSSKDSYDEEFESADEEIKGEDIDIAELGLDDDESDPNEALQQTESSNSNQRLEKTVNLNDQSILEAVEVETEKYSIKENEPISNEEKQIDENENNDYKSLDSQTKELIVDYNQEILKSTNIQDLCNQSDEDILSNKTEAIEKSPKTSLVPTDTKDLKITSGWDDTELSDLEDDILDIPSPEIKNVNEKNSINKSDELETKTEKNETKSSGWSWSSFGSSFISTATSSVANVANQLGTGLNTVLETVEQTIGAPDPVQLAIAAKEAKKEQHDLNEEKITDETKTNEINDWNNDDQEWFTITSLANKGSQLVSGSLNVLETVGKKTFETLSERDPNLQITRGLLNKVPNALPSSQKPNLSQLLREAKEARTTGFETQKQIKPLKNQVVKLTFGLFFEEFKGAANLEALEILSHQENVKVELNSALIKKNRALNSNLKSIEEFFNPENINEDWDQITESESDDQFAFITDFKKLVTKEQMLDSDSFEALINDYSDELSVKIKIDKVISSFQTSTSAVKEISDPQELLNESIKSFALITATLVECFQKLTETILIEQQKNQKKPSNSLSSIENAKYLFQITKLCIRSITLLADDFCQKCRFGAKNSNDKGINQITTDIYLEASNSSTYIGDTFLLLNPIFKSQIIDCYL